MATLKPKELIALAYDWKQWARPEQLPPPGQWSNWMVKAGRGFGKTRTGSETVRQWIKEGFRQVNIIVRTKGDIEKVLIRSQGGLLKACPPDERPRWIGNKNEFLWPNGATSFVFSAEEPDSLRGPEHSKLWCDELAAWRFGEDTWDNAMMGLRIGPSPQVIITTTPRPTKLVRQIIADPYTVMTVGSTYANRANLADRFFEQIIRKYEGTRLGRQELNAEVLDDNPGALFKRADIDSARVRHPRGYVRIVVALDPAVTSNEDSDEWGIIVAAELDQEDKSKPPQYDVLEDASAIYSPDEAAKKAVILYHQYEADRIIGEANNGGDMIEALLRHVDPNVSYHKVTASRGKAIRAEPISALYEQRRVHHVGFLAKLEDELCEWNPQVDENSPNRLDACLIAGTLVKTRRGEIPIEQVLVGDEAMTRQGWRRVLASQMTAQKAKIITVQTGDGRTLAGTANHPVWVDKKGFSRLDSVVCGDRLCLWSKPFILRASNTPETLNLPTSSGAIISALREVQGKANSIVRCGFRRSVRFLKAVTFTIPTRTLDITNSITLSVFRRKNMLRAMQGGIVSNADFMPLRYGHWLLPGTAQRLAELSTQNLASSPGKVVNVTFKSNVPDAESIRRALSNETVRAIVRGAVTAQRRIVSTATNIGYHARSAGLSSGRVNTESNPSSAPASVVRSYASGEAPVYNLEVEGEHEYFANGILVHNCVWAITELSGFGPDGFREYYKRKADKSKVKQNRAEPPTFGPGGAAKMLPKDARKWSIAIQFMQLETKAEAITKEEWEGGFCAELRDWIRFCEQNGGGARLAFALKELARLEKKFGAIPLEVS